MIDHIMLEKNWKITGRLTLPAHAGEYFSTDGLRLSRQSAVLLNALFPAGIYLHQKEAIKASLEGGNICLATGTA